MTICCRDCAEKEINRQFAVITELQDENARLKKEKGEYGYSQESMDALTKERDNLQAENARLKTIMQKATGIVTENETLKVALDCELNTRGELKDENEKLKEVIQSALEIKALWEPADGWANVDEATALVLMAERFEVAIKE